MTNLNDNSVVFLPQSRLLLGGPVVEDLERWCSRHKRRREGIIPRLAVVYFDTGADAREYLHIKAEVAAKAGVDYTTHKLLPDASIEEVINRIATLNEDGCTHGILVQRPIPKQLCEETVMKAIVQEKHVEEHRQGKRSNIAVDGLRRLLAAYRKEWMLKLDIVLLGGTNIITSEFKAEMKRRFRWVDFSTALEGRCFGSERETVIITEMNNGGCIKPRMVGPMVKLVIDLGFDVNTGMGDLDPAVQRMEHILIVPTPGGALPILLWLMMERTIKSSSQVGQGKHLRSMTRVFGCNIL